MNIYLSLLEYTCILCIDRSWQWRLRESDAFHSISHSRRQSLVSKFNVDVILLLEKVKFGIRTLWVRASLIYL